MQKKPPEQPSSNHTAIVHKPVPPAPRKGSKVIGVLK